MEDIALVPIGAGTAPVCSHHICPAAQVPIIIGLNRTLYGVRPIIALDNIPEFRMVAPRLVCQRHIFVVLVNAFRGEDKQLEAAVAEMLRQTASSN